MTLDTLLLSDKTSDLNTAAGIIRSGGLVVFPTETVYGLGADACSNSAVNAIFRAKGRPQDNPLIVHIANTDQLSMVSDCVSSSARLLFETFSPGPLTIILPRSPHLSPKVSAGLSTVAVRIPSHPIAKTFLELCQTPVAAPSANISGRPSPTTAEMALQDLNGRVHAVINGGSCEVGLESTVIRVTDREILLLRPGAITPDMLSETTGLPVTMPPSSAKTESPGVRYAHYQPDAEVYLYQPNNINLIYKYFEPQKTAVLSVSDKKINGFTTICFESEEDYAKNLYAILVELDRKNFKTILAPTVKEQGLGLALMNRLKKAAANKYISDLSSDS